MIFYCQSCGAKQLQAPASVSVALTQCKCGSSTFATWKPTFLAIQPAPSQTETPKAVTDEPIARWSNGVCKTCGEATHSCRCNHPKSRMLNEVFSVSPTPCPSCGGVRERHLEQQLSQAKRDAERYRWLRERGEFPTTMGEPRWLELDATIDAALAKREGEGEK